MATNYSKLLGWTRGNFWRWVLNSLIYSGVSALIGTIVSVMAGYATAKFNFRGKNVAIGIIMEHGGKSVYAANVAKAIMDGYFHPETMPEVE